MAEKMNSTEAEAKKWVEAINDDVYKSIEKKESLTIRNFGKFYVRETSRGDVSFKVRESERLRGLKR